MTSLQPNTNSWTLSIDFGTSSTVAAITHDDGRHEVLEVEGERRTPSVVLVDDDHSLVVGAAAVGLAASRPERTIRAPKRRLGDQTPVVLGGKPFNPVDLVAAVLRFVRNEAERYVGSAPTSVRLTHPATWGRPLQQRLLEAAAKAGMPDADLVPEPVAAAMAAADRNLPGGSYIAVYDLGGGTFDTTVVQSTEHGFQVVGHPIGDRQIGGELFDEALMNHVGSRLDPGMWERLQVSGEREWHQAAARLLSECRRVKEALSTHGYGEVVVGTPDGMIDERVTRDELEAIVAPYLDASVDLLERCVDDVGIDPSQLAAIHLIGGASRMPLAATTVEEAFPGVEVSRRGDPRTAVAVGASLVDLARGPAADVIADRNTTVERRVRSIDAEAAAIDAEAAGRASAPTGPVVTPPTDSMAAPPPSTATAAAADPSTLAAATPAQPPPQTTVPIAPLAATPANSPTAGPPPSTFATPPPGSGSPAGSGSTGGQDNTPLLVLIGLLAVAVIGFGAFVFTRGGDDDPDEAGPSASETTTASIEGALSTIADPGTTLAPDTTPATQPTTTPTTQPPTTPPTTAAPAGPSREDAQGLLLDLRDLPPDGWQNGIYDPEPLEPCGLGDPHLPLFVEGRTFDKNPNEANASSISHSILVYESEAQAAAVIEFYQNFSASCLTDVITIEGIDFDAAFVACDPFATCPDPLPAAGAGLLAGDRYALQFALLTEPVSGLSVTDQVYAMQLGRTIVQFEYVVLGEPTDVQLTEAGNLAVTAWTRANGFPR